MDTPIQNIFQHLVQRLPIPSTDDHATQMRELFEVADAPYHIHLTPGQNLIRFLLAGGQFVHDGPSIELILGEDYHPHLPLNERVWQFIQAGGSIPAPSVTFYNLPLSFEHEEIKEVTIPYFIRITGTLVTPGQINHFHGPADIQGATPEASAVSFVSTTPTRRDDHQTSSHTRSHYPNYFHPSNLSVPRRPFNLSYLSRSSSQVNPSFGQNNYYDPPDNTLGLDDLVSDSVENDPTHPNNDLDPDRIDISADIEPTQKTVDCLSDRLHTLKTVINEKSPAPITYIPFEQDPHRPTVSIHRFIQKNLAQLKQDGVTIGTYTLCLTDGHDMIDFTEFDPADDSQEWCLCKQGEGQTNKVYNFIRPETADALIASGKNPLTHARLTTADILRGKAVLDLISQS